MIDIGRSLNQKVIAEGIETEGTLSFLRNRNCAEGQGYYFSRPIPAEGLANLLAASPMAPLSPPSAR
jgi:EAL domain-containing protein (putative c-di-GMP-specific phosphodiesterase class I)